MDSRSRLRSQSVTQARPGGITLPARATRILQKVTGRIRWYPSRKPVSVANDDNDPYPSQAGLRSSIGGVKPYMSQPLLNSTIVKPYEPGYEQDSPTQSASPSGSVFRGSIDQHKRSEATLATHTTFAAVAATAPPAINELPLAFVQDEHLVWNNDHKPRVRPPRPSRPLPNAPASSKHHPLAPKIDPVVQTVSSSVNPTGQSATPPPAPPLTSPKQIKAETPSTFSPARLFTRKASRPNLHDRKSADDYQNTLPPSPPPPPVPAKNHHLTPSITIPGVPESAEEMVSSLPSGAKRTKPAKIDTSLYPARLFTRKPSRPQLQESYPNQTAEDSFTPYTNEEHDAGRSPSPPPPLPKIFSTRSKTHSPVPLASSSSTASTSSYFTTASYSTATDTTLNTTPASTSMNEPSSLLTPLPGRITTAVSTSAIPTSPPPPILQRSETAPHSYRLSLRFSSSYARPPPLPIFNLPTLPPTSPSTSSPQRLGLRDVPQLSHDGGHREPDEGDDDLDEDEEGRISRTSDRATPFLDLEHEDEDGDDDSEGYRPSFNASIGDLSIATTSSSFNASLGVGDREGREGKTHSRSSSYNHSISYSLSNSTSHDTDASTSFAPSTSFASSDFLSLPGPDMSRFDLDLSFLDGESSPSTTQVPVSQNWKGKARATPEDDDREYGEEGGKTPTIGKVGGYFDASTPVNYVLPVRKESLRLRTGPDVLGRGIGKGKGKEKEWEEEIDTAKPQLPGALQASISLGEPALGISPGLGLGLSGSGIYASKRASMSLFDLGATERREKVEEIVRDEEEKKMERRKSRLGRIEGSGSGEVTVKVPKLRIDTQLGVGEVWKEGEGAVRVVLESGASESTMKVLNGNASSNGEATSGYTTPKPSTNKRLSKAPPYETVVRKRRSLPMFTEATDPPPYPAFPPLSPSNIHNVTPFGLHNHNHNSRQGGLSIEPRDDEGREPLPPYSNALYMRAVLPRKMEFTSAGVQARDRKWRRVVCVVEGTSLKMYKPRERSGKGMIGAWWERQVGVGDVSMSTGPVIRPKSEEGGETRREQIPKLYGEGTDPAGQIELELRPPPTPVTPITPERTQPRLTGEHPFVPGQPQASSIYANPQPQANRSRLNLAVSNLLKPSTAKFHSRSRSDSRANSDATNLNPSLNGYGNGNSFARSSSNVSGTANSSVGPGHSSRGSFSSNRSGTPSGHSHNLSVPSSSSLVHSQTSSVSPTHAIDDPRDLIRVYTMQNAESGLGNDYIKRKNVIRVRVEGEQFLLQAKDVADVVAWIEILQASANIALDLDERLMPKGPLFPRRRRRRPRPAATTTGTGVAAGANTSTSVVTTTAITNIASSASVQVALPL